jgi:cytochrome b subunit of formate dehydrogenase
MLRTGRQKEMEHTYIEAKVLQPCDMRWLVAQILVFSENILTKYVRNSTCPSYLSQLSACDYAAALRHAVSGSIISYKVNIVFQIYDWRSQIFVWFNLYCCLGAAVGGHVYSDDEVHVGLQWEGYVFDTVT